MASAFTLPNILLTLALLTLIVGIANAFGTNKDLNDFLKKVRHEQQIELAPYSDQELIEAARYRGRAMIFIALLLGLAWFGFFSV